MAEPAPALGNTDKHYLEFELDELAQSRRLWEFVQDGSLDGVWYWDLENPQNEWMSPEFWQLLGFDPNTKTHNPAEWQDLIHPEDLRTAVENFERHCADPNHPYDQIVRYIHANGSTIWVRCRGLAIRNKSGKPIRMLGAHNDVTSLMVAEEATRREKELAFRANEELRTFSYSISHDLKSPANTVRMLLAEIRRSLKEGNDADVAHLLDKAETTVNAMRFMVDDLLAYTRVIGGETKLVPVDLDDILRQVVSILDGEVQASGAEITLDACGWVMGCDWQLRLLFQNLLSNAIKFRAKNTAPRVRVTMTKGRDGRKHVSVVDDGIGIAAQDQAKIFDLFTKLHRPTNFIGSGIGLALCQRVAQTHGANIHVASQPQKGTQFTVSLKPN